MVREVQRRTITNGNRMLLYGKRSGTVAPKGSVDSSVRTYFHMNFFGYKDIFVETNYVRLANRHFIFVKFFANKYCPRK